MLDIENYVVNTIQNAFDDAGITVLVDSVFQPSPKEFPCVMVQEVDNIPMDYTQDLEELYRRVLYQIDVIVAETPIKQNCVKLMEIADNAMHNMKFSRVEYDLSTSEDRTMAWGTMQYRAIVGRPKKVGNDQVYQMYRQ